MRGWGGMGRLGFGRRGGGGGGGGCFEVGGINEGVFWVQVLSGGWVGCYR